MCISRYFAVFPLANLVNAIARYRKRAEVLPHSHSVMLFWAGGHIKCLLKKKNLSNFKIPLNVFTYLFTYLGLRGAVAFALAAGLQGDNASAMRTTILVVVVLSVIVFGGTTSRMLEILRIETGVEDDNDSSDDEVQSDCGYGHSSINSEGSIESNGSGNSPSSTEHHDLLSRAARPTLPPSVRQTHWFISFDDRFLKPLFTRQSNQRHVDERSRNVDRRHAGGNYAGLLNSRTIDIPESTKRPPNLNNNNDNNDYNVNNDHHSNVNNNYSMAPRNITDDRNNSERNRNNLRGDHKNGSNTSVSQSVNVTENANNDEGIYQSFTDLSVLIDHNDDDNNGTMNDKDSQPLVILKD